MEIMVITGEASGDLHGSALIHELRTLVPDCHFSGIGGRNMAEAGVELLFEVDALGVTGFTEVFWKLGHIYHVFQSILSMARRRRPIAILLIDYPDFNLRLARRLHDGHSKIIYYVSPQLWAWRSGRVKTIQKYIDKMMVLFPFEEEWYQQRGVDAVFVGNPIVDRMGNLPEKSACRNALQLPTDRKILAILPGSRSNEVTRILPVLLEASHQLQQQCDVHVVLPVAPTVSTEFIRSFVKSSMKVDIRETSAPMIQKAADFAWVASGTATLETALAQTPSIIVYKTSLLSYWLAKSLINVKYIGIANLIMDEAVSVELIQDELTVENLLRETIPLLHNAALWEQHQQKLLQLKAKLALPNAARRAALEILKTCMITAPPLNYDVSTDL